MYQFVNRIKGKPSSVRVQINSLKEGCLFRYPNSSNIHVLLGLDQGEYASCVSLSTGRPFVIDDINGEVFIVGKCDVEVTIN